MENRNRNSRPIKNQDPINEFIRAHQVLVIDEDKQNLGVMSKRQALEIAKSKNLDLYQVGVQPDGTVITRIVNYGKLKYEQQKKSKEAKKHQAKIENKEIRITVNIGKHDLETKARKAKEFLEEGSRVKVSLKFRGREVVYLDLGQQTLNNFLELVSDVGKMEKEAKLNGKFLDMYIVPKKN
ncbi:translation initiation factor IF-3 [Mycoplasma feriruminatoris]|uniref:Translation initiation factor IF-3 n=1 Tax=Mycoplasma feriruminatoris TaxID=1179777 RepID=A0A654IJT3_9MOLU|nr:translation initiation factor IF-3 [Mycoplasma feriruminatoris]WFQ91221.1 translation initiation factor IF-3 [Mycoplasma feriruminatoris]WFQ92041.1 Translation initiation factor IF-3 [Mycoplasma feriruminatoris]WFQ92886.1 Translation initiation factor IF-3 [Mycoplasma feriruminatoris]WFQ93728.1 translation initiation factor IF-3 [Mycoplasma feriruminatoris]WFQ94568.1 Translation initiation factor IF-3 [Mycoplasma feriruminatoris]